MRTSNVRLNPSIKKQITKSFDQLIADINSPEDVAILFKDFFNDSEYETFVKRLAVAYWLKKGRSYENIKQNLKVSSATIASVQTQVKKPGFVLALKRIEADEWANVWSEKIKNFVKK